MALSSLIKDIKLANHDFIKREKMFVAFKEWQEGYGAFTHHFNNKNRSIHYLKNQEAHHGHVSWPDLSTKALGVGGRVKGAFGRTWSCL